MTTRANTHFRRPLSEHSARNWFGKGFITHSSIHERFKMHGLPLLALQKLSTVRPFSCTACGESPDLVIADGVSLSFRADRIKPELNPPTYITVNGDTVRI